MIWESLISSGNSTRRIAKHQALFVFFKGPFYLLVIIIWFSVIVSLQSTHTTPSVYTSSIPTSGKQGLLLQSIWTEPPLPRKTHATTSPRRVDLVSLFFLSSSLVALSIYLFFLVSFPSFSYADIPCFKKLLSLSLLRLYFDISYVVLMTNDEDSLSNEIPKIPLLSYH